MTGQNNQAGKAENSFYEGGIAPINGRVTIMRAADEELISQPVARLKASTADESACEGIEKLHKHPTHIPDPSEYYLDFPQTQTLRAD